MTYQRVMPQDVRDKISSSLTGRKLSDATKERISQGVKKAWARVPKTVDLWGADENNSDKTCINDESTKV